MKAKRHSIRGMMVLVALVALMSWLIDNASKVWHEPNADQISHLRRRLDTGEVVVLTHPVEGTFWPRYWRRLLGKTWPDGFVCPSCLENHQKSDQHPLVDVATSSDGSKMIKEMLRLQQVRLDQEVREAYERAIQERLEEERRRGGHGPSHPR